MDKPDFYRTLIQRYKNKTATDQELEAFFQLIREGELDESLLDEMDVDLGDAVVKTSAVRRRRNYYLAAAAVLLLGLGIGYVFQSRLSGPTNQLASPIAANDVPAGGNRATLTLPDGSQIMLDDAEIGAVAEHGSVRIDKTKDGQLVYHLAAAASGSHTHPGDQSLHEISTPRGGQYQVVLPDGSNVWLNADSRLRFPPVFTADKREVYLQGEGFFAIEHNDSPFIVHADDQQVQVLGTQFNIRAYQGEPTIQTTLLTGSVKVGHVGAALPYLLKPNQQSAFDRQTKSVTIANVTAQEYAAWKDGYFTFTNTELATVMQDIARWYDVTIDVDRMPNKKLYAVLPRDVSLVTLLDMIDLTSETKFELKERRVYLVQ